MARLDTFYFGTNTKMYKTIAETVAYLEALIRLTADVGRESMELFVIPSFTALAAAKQCGLQRQILLGAQNMGWEDEGQFTGEISPLMLNEVGVEIVEIGHSERRHVLGETDEMENRKVRCALRHGFRPLLCVGETAEQKQYGIADEILSMQLKIGLYGVSPARAESLMIAYEPVWAIGTGGTPATEAYVADRHRFIKTTLAALFGQNEGRNIPVLYGGSVNLENAVSYSKCPGVDGLFIGRSAWRAEDFNAIIRAVMEIRAASTEKCCAFTSECEK